MIDQAMQPALIRSTSLLLQERCEQSCFYCANIKSPREHGNAISPVNWVSQWDERDRDCLGDKCNLTE
jgi:hypothetical protein